ncbi:MAG: glutamate 5-kinase [Planctomycetota bacterium]|nr:glutamate 5-kinase [Planctomycetota bacterium]
MIRRSIPTPSIVVVKVGSAVLAPEGVPDPGSFARLASSIAEARKRGMGVVLVSSGAVASGFRALGLAKPPKDIALKQAAAAVGQGKLIARWADALLPHKVEVAQVLYTAEDLDGRQRFLNARRTMSELIGAGVVPIVNENDSVSFAEIKLGDNDRLSALTSGLVDAGLLLILSSVAGLYEHGRKGKIVAEVRSIAEAEQHVQAEKSGVGTGGMQTKLWAAGTATRWGIATVIASGGEPDVICRVVDGEPLGTYFPARERGRTARQRWIETSARPKGTIVVDEGCAAAVVKKGASVLPRGVVRVETVAISPGGRHGVEGEDAPSFPRGSPVQVATLAGVVFARGISSYSSEEIARIAGKPANQIASVLGYSYCDEVIHRDDLVLTRV